MSAEMESAPPPPDPSRKGTGEETRCGFVAVLGAPNAGKSTLVNALVGSKVAIVTQKVQTTRIPVRGIAIEGKAQIVFVDTPGIFAPMRSWSWQTQPSFRRARTALPRAIRSASSMG
jgi:GTP-binding protein Era